MQILRSTPSQQRIPQPLKHRRQIIWHNLVKYLYNSVIYNLWAWTWDMLIHRLLFGTIPYHITVNNMEELGSLSQKEPFIVPMFVFLPRGLLTISFFATKTYWLRFIGYDGQKFFFSFFLFNVGFDRAFFIYSFVICLFL